MPDVLIASKQPSVAPAVALDSAKVESSTPIKDKKSVAKPPENSKDLKLENVYRQKNLDLSKDQLISFLHHPIVKDKIPDLINVLNIVGNGAAFMGSAFGFSAGAKNLSEKLGQVGTKAFLIANGLINTAERLMSGNFLSALGYFNDVVIGTFVPQEHTYLARGAASGIYNLANSLNNRAKKASYSSFGEHIKQVSTEMKSTIKDLFSADVFKNFMDSKKSMFGVFGGLTSVAGALAWLGGGGTKIPTLIRDVGGVVMDFEQLNLGHLKNGRSLYFYSGISLAIGTICDYLSKLVPDKKGMLVPMTFLLDGIGRHLLRLFQNKEEFEKQVGRRSASNIVDMPQAAGKVADIGGLHASAA